MNEKGGQLAALLSISMLDERVKIRVLKNNRKEAEQYKQTHQGRNDDNQNQGHDNLLSRVENGY